MRMIFLILIVAIIAMLIYYSYKAFVYWTNKREAERSKWRILPKTDEFNNDTEIWISRGMPGQLKSAEEFLFWPTTRNASWEYDRAMMEAEVERDSLNRQQRELLR